MVNIRVKERKEKVLQILVETTFFRASSEVIVEIAHPLQLNMR